MSNQRVAIVGAGMGGLVVAALLLAARGLQTVMVERAAGPGGKMRELVIGEAAVDAGPTVFTMRWVLDEILAEVGAALDAHLRLTPAETLARHVWSSGARLDLHADRDRAADAIAAFAGPAEAARYRQFCDRAARIYRTLEGPFLRAPAASLPRLIRETRTADLWEISPFTTLWRALGEHFRDPRLRQLFGRYATYCGSSPFSAPATLMLVAHVEQEGVWLVEGGMRRIADMLAGLARQQGAVIRYGAEVAEILVEGGRAAGLRLADGETIPADAVIVNADPAALGAGLFGRAAARAVSATAPGSRSLSAVTWALSAATRGVPLLRHNVFFSDDYRAEFDDILRHRRLPLAPTVYVCAQDRGGSDTTAPAMTTESPEEERLLCLVNAPPNGDRHAFPETEIRRCEDRAFRFLEMCGLEIRLRPEATRVTSPADFNLLFPGTGGALYGIASHGWRASFSRPGCRTRLPGPYPAGGSIHPGTGRADGGPVGPARRDLPDAGFGPEPRFDGPVAPNGYAWWYVDALSDDLRYGLTLIIFIGSVFSPYYAWARRRGPADPLDHCAVNVALYGPGAERWALTERGRDAVHRERSSLVIGRSAVDWDGTVLTVDFDELTAPLPSRIRGRVRLHPGTLVTRGFTLDAGGRHRWRPIAPLSRVEVALERCALSWSGSAYFDTNDGDEPLEAGFRRWDWSRTAQGEDASILYDATRRDGSRQVMALRIGRDGAVTTQDAPPLAPLPKGLWRVPRWTRADAGHAPRLLRRLEDSPFYTRSVIATRLFGEAATAVHESLSLDRFVTLPVQLMIPFRMPRAIW